MLLVLVRGRFCIVGTESDGDLAALEHLAAVVGGARRRLLVRTPAEVSYA